VPDAALMLMSWALITVGAVAGMESLSRPRPEPELDDQWLRFHEADVWRAMGKVSADARKGKYESGTFQGTQGKR
jgi:hypothetical protein